MKDLILSIINIFRNIGKGISMLRVLTLNIAFLFLIYLIVISITSSTPKKDEVTERSGALVLTLSGKIVEQKEINDPFSSLMDDKLGFDNLPKETLLQDVLDVIAEAAVDDNVKCILLDLSALDSAGLDQLQRIGKALNNFKKYGKKVIAAEDYYRQKAYYLACYADEIYLNPMGGVYLHGMGTFRLYFKDALEHLKINYNIFRVGTFKSALEPITRNSMSDEAKTQNMSWLSSLWKTMQTDLIRERKLSEETIRNYTDNIASELATAGGDTALLALHTGLVDGLKTRQEIRSYLKKLAGTSKEGDYRRIDFQNYLRNITPSFTAPAPKDGTVGLIIAEGPILGGDQDVGAIGGDSLAKLIKKAANNDKIKALVVRVVSGGGSAFASEIIRQEILEFKKTKKPFIISMGSAAASGGYWISADADEIWASPATLTGSIGIFAAIPTFEKSLAELGIYNDGVGTTGISGSMNISRPLSSEIKESINISLRHGYERFLNIVANGRAIDRRRLESIAEGRVFDGIKAMELGLVDKLGNMDDAIASAAAMAGLSTPTASYIRKPFSVKDEIMQIFSSRIGSRLTASLPPSMIFAARNLFSTVREFSLFNDPNGLYVHYMINYPDI